MKKIIFVLLIFLFINISLYADISIQLSGDIVNAGNYTGITQPDIDNITDKLENDLSVELNSLASLIADSFTVATVSNAPIGDIKINNFTLGVSATAAAAIDLGSDITSAGGALPKIGGGLSMSLFFGMSLHKRWDLILMALYVPPINYKGFKFNIYAGGLRLRYIFRKKKASKANDFQGISISSGFFYSYSTLNYSLPSLDKSTSFSTGLAAPLPESGTFTIRNFNGNGNIVVMSADFEIRFHFRVFYILNLFLAVGSSLNFSYLKLDVSSDVNNYVEVTNPIPPPPVFSSSVDGTLSATGKAYSSKIAPRIVGGFELNLWVRILVQGMLSWSKGKTMYVANFAFRFEF